MIAIVKNLEYNAFDIEPNVLEEYPVIVNNLEEFKKWLKITYPKYEFIKENEEVIKMKLEIDDSFSILKMTVVAKLYNNVEEF